MGSIQFLPAPQSRTHLRYSGRALATFYIYALCDATGQIRYIGQTFNPKQRLSSHRRNNHLYSNQDLHDWLTTTPFSMAILATVQGRHSAIIAEEQAIEHAREAGALLLNKQRYVRFGGRYGSAART